MMDAKDIAKLLLDAKALKFNVAEPFTYVSGIKSPVYMDCRLLISDVAGRRKIVDGISGLLSCLDCDVVAATASAAIPWGAWVAEKIGKPLVYVRKSEKDHGTKKLVEGSIRDGDATVLVEDLVSTGKSSLAAVQSLRDVGAEVVDCVSIFSYGLSESDISFKNAGVQLHPLSNFKTALDVAASSGYLLPDEASEALKWQSDTRGWRK